MNTLTGLIPTIYASLGVVSRELIGFIPAVNMDANPAERAAIGQVVRSPLAPVPEVNDVNASMQIPEGDDQDLSYVDMTITDSKAVQIPFPGEDQLALGQNMTSIFGQQMQQAFRKLANMIEADVASNYVKASRAYGTAGVTPFASGVGDAAQVRKLLVDNGAMGDLRLVVGTSAGANLRTNTQLTKADEANTDATLRRGTLLDLAGISIHESAAVPVHIPTPAVGNEVNTGGPDLPVGTMAIPYDTGTGAFSAGDIVSTDNDNNKYVVNSGTAGNINLNENGILVPWHDDDTISKVDTPFEANFAFERNAVQLAVRAPALPDGGDAAVDRTTVTDPVSGISFDISVYLGYKKKMIEVSVAWGTEVTTPRHTAILLG